MTEFIRKRIDLEFEDSIVEVRNRIAAIRDLHSCFFKISQLALVNECKNIFLILVNPKMSNDRIQIEWGIAKKVLSPSVGKRLFIVVFLEDKITLQSPGIQTKYIEGMERIFSPEKNAGRKKLQKTDFKAEVLKILLNAWIVHAEKPSHCISEFNLQFAIGKDFPRQRLLTINKLEEMAGCTYRTIDRAFEFIGTAIQRNGNKGFGLKYFPRHAWEQMVVLSSKSRSTMKFTDRSGRPRSPDSLMKRLGRLNRSDIAVGGVTGAARVLPELDITGSPRLDLTVHSPDGVADMSFIKNLDPALRPWRKNDPPPSLAVHFLRRKPSFFRVDKEGILWADPIECLLDLLEARLEYQALQFRNAILPGNVHRDESIANKSIRER